MNLVPPSHPALWAVASEVVDFAPIPALARQMIDLMTKHGGIGLAAPQVGLSIRLYVARQGARARAFVNPVIVSVGRDMEPDWEGCLSFPAQGQVVNRHRVITVDYHDETGLSLRETFKGMDARCAAHEIDHLNGVCILPRPPAPLAQST